MQGVEGGWLTTNIPGEDTTVTCSSEASTGDTNADSPLTRASPSEVTTTTSPSSSLAPPAGEDASRSGGPAITDVVTSTISVPSS